MNFAASANSVLHLLLSAEQSAWQDCLRACQSTDTVVLLDAGVMGLVGSSPNSIKDFPCAVIASKPDVSARVGTVGGVNTQVTLVSDDELIGLLADHPRCLSWR